jgi:hypothetical protein
MASGAESDFRRKFSQENRNLDPEQRMSLGEINSKAREAAREYSSYEKKVQQEDQKPVSSRDLLQMNSSELKRIDRSSGGGSFWGKLFH